MQLKFLQNSLVQQWLSKHGHTGLFPLPLYSGKLPLALEDLLLDNKVKHTQLEHAALLSLSF